MVVIERLVLVGNSDANMKFAFYVHPFANHARCVVLIAFPFGVVACVFVAGPFR